MTALAVNPAPACARDGTNGAPHEPQARDRTDCVAAKGNAGSSSRTARHGVRTDGGQP